MIEWLISLGPIIGGAAGTFLALCALVTLVAVVTQVCNLLSSPWRARMAEADARRAEAERDREVAGAERRGEHTPAVSTRKG